MTNENNNQGPNNESWARRISGEVQHEQGQEEGRFQWANDPVVTLSKEDRQYLNGGLGGLGSIRVRRSNGYAAAGGRLIVGGLAGAGAVAVMQSRLSDLAKFGIIGAAVVTVFFKRDWLF